MRRALAHVPDAVGAGLAKLGISLAVLAFGFRAVSDDDYARIVIAQRFAQTPHADPSGTSWLPLPFWIYGACFRVFGGSLAVARVVAVLAGMASIALLLVAARWLGAGRFGCLVGVLVAALFPWSAWLGAAPVPELPAAALSVLGMAALAQRETRARLVGAAAVGAACFSRYEGWPVAVAFAALTLHDAWRAPAARRGMVAAAAVALAPIALWLLHGVFIHGDATFFWKRVAAYKNALGLQASFSERFWSVPRSFLTLEPELWFGLLLAGVSAPLARRYARPAVAALALLLFLMAGEINGGGPTHHTGRAVLPIWILVALALGAALEERCREAGARVAGWLGLVAALLGLGWWLRAGTPPAFAERGDAVTIGARARELGAPALLIDTPDYAYLAVTAAFEKPDAATPFDDRDPRHARAADPFVSETTLRARVREQRGAWLVVTREHLPLATRIGSIRAETPTLALVAVSEPPIAVRDGRMERESAGHSRAPAPSHAEKALVQ
jgi:hypothetical protein